MQSSRFLDEVRIRCASGRGGHGRVSWRREKYVPKGGPAGGDGGRGGHVIFVATEDENTLLSLRFRADLRAGNGEHGGTSRKTGADGADQRIVVPVGTIVRSAETGEVLADLSTPGVEWIALRGGRGGRGNCHFTTSTRQAPDFAEDGEAGLDAELDLELKLLADVGLLGFPNAGKSTLISVVSAARPKVAAYPFTTLEPSLGVVQVPGTFRSFVMADIPGLIEGAAEGAGLGHRFLRHVERCRLLLHLVSLDPLEEEGTGALDARIHTLEQELERFDPELARRPRVLVLSKADLLSDEEIEAKRAVLADRFGPALVVSAATGAGVRELIREVANRLDSAPAAR